MFIKPVTRLIDGVSTEIKLRDPVLRDFIPSEGRLVENSGYWQRRINEGDAIEVQEEQESSPSKNAKGNKGA